MKVWLIIIFYYMLNFYQNPWQTWQNYWMAIDVMRLIIIQAHEKLIRIWIENKKSYYWLKNKDSLTRSRKVNPNSLSHTLYTSSLRLFGVFS